MLLKFAKRTASFGGRRLLSSHAASGVQRVPFRARLNGAAAGSVGAAAAGLSMSMYASLHSTPASSECCPGGGAAPEKGKGNHSGVEHYQLRQDIIDTCLKMNAIGINQGTSGNVSARVPGGFLITPSGIPYETLSPEQ
eukprot:gene11363-32583_t